MLLFATLNASTVSAGRSLAQSQTPQNSDVDSLNFALNLEYIEAEFYSCAATGRPIPGEKLHTSFSVPPAVQLHPAFCALCQQALPKQCCRRQPSPNLREGTNIHCVCNSIELSITSGKCSGKTMAGVAQNTCVEEDHPALAARGQTSHKQDR